VKNCHKITQSQKHQLLLCLSTFLHIDESSCVKILKDITHDNLITVCSRTIRWEHAHTMIPKDNQCTQQSTELHGPRQLLVRRNQTKQYPQRVIMHSMAVMKGSERNKHIGSTYDWIITWAEMLEFLDKRMCLSVGGRLNLHGRSLGCSIELRPSIEMVFSDGLCSCLRGFSTLAFSF
jgi:hypothetical protein